MEDFYSQCLAKAQELSRARNYPNGYKLLFNEEIQVVAEGLTETELKESLRKRFQVEKLVPSKLQLIEIGAQETTIHVTNLNRYVIR